MIGKAPGVGMGLINMILWGSASLALSRSAFASCVAISVGAQLWTCDAVHSDMGGLSRLSLHPKRTATEQAVARCFDGLNQCLAMWHGAQLNVEVRTSRPRSLQQMPCSCGALSSCGVEAPHAQQDVMGLPVPREWTAIAPGTWALVCGGRLDREHRGDKEGLHQPPGRASGSYLAGTKEEGSFAA